MPGKYKDYRIYCCFALNRLVSALGIDLEQQGLEEKLDGILEEADYRVTKEDIKHEIRSNHYMTTKVLAELEEEGYVRVVRHDKEYRIFITKEGLLYIKRYNVFFREMYQAQIEDHYKYKGLPAWARGE